MDELVALSNKVFSEYYWWAVYSNGFGLTTTLWPSVSGVANISPLKWNANYINDEMMGNDSIKFYQNNNIKRFYHDKKEKKKKANNYPQYSF